MHVESPPGIVPELGTGVSAFVARAGLVDVLPKVLELTQAVLSSAEGIRVYLEEDPEIADQRFVIVDVRVPSMGASEALDAWEEWHRAVGRNVPSTRAGAFCLRLARVGQSALQLV